MANKKVTKKVTKKRVKKNVEHGQAHIQSSFNNTIVNLTDAEGNSVCRADGSRNSYKGSFNPWIKDRRCFCKGTGFRP